MILRSFFLACLALGVWAMMTGWEPEILFVRLTWGALGLWCGLLGFWIAIRRRTGFKGRPVRKFFVRLIDLSFALLPGVILIAYGALAPAAPSLTQGGFDVCDTSPGYCVSGTRAFVPFGIFTIIIGVILNWVVGLEAPIKSTSDSNE